MTTVVIRADASRTMGIGHIKRCLSVAAALQQAGAVAVLAWRHVDVDCRPVIELAGCTSICIADTALGDQYVDAQAFVAAAQPHRPDFVLVDHYGLDAVWHRTVRALLPAKRLGAIDDLGDRPLDVDLLVDHNHSADHQLKYSDRLQRPARLLGGAAYAMLAPSFAHAPRRSVSDIVTSIGIFMGGTDDGGYSAMVHATLRRHLAFAGPIEIATTSGNRHLQALRAVCQQDQELTLTVDQQDLAQFFARHDLHIGAGGGATWERCCTGAPSVAVIVADNQRSVILPIAGLGVLSVVDIVPPTPEVLAPAIASLMRDAQARRAMARAAQALVDGRGCQRIAREILAP
ncbi:MAG: UDP-2,4-diacetamido-2,4,6-trideoxy-beta-L-altropyranose hydrolase [Burkholderiales bacterium]|nr:UDP-2,4-diacetamido-2,4,6-trideoxy-beta-L-altropyranose hydrolase [Burkholderiales bacterium]